MRPQTTVPVADAVAEPQRTSGTRTTIALHSRVCSIVRCAQSPALPHPTPPRPPAMHTQRVLVQEAAEHNGTAQRTKQTMHTWMITILLALRTIVLLFLFCCCCMSAVTVVKALSADAAARVQYLFVAHAGSGALPLTADPDGAWTQLYAGAGASSPGAPRVDDMPLWALDLLFLFRFNSRPYRRVFLSPNGYAAFQNDEAQCCSWIEDPSLDALEGMLVRKCFQYAASASAPACNFNSSYSNIIAAFLADLNPGASADARVSFLSTPTVFKARWIQLPFFQRSFEDSTALPSPITVQLELHASGTIILRMIDVVDPNAGSGNSDAGAGNRAGADEQLRPWIAAALRFDTSATPPSIERSIAPLFDDALSSSNSNSTRFPELSLYAAQAGSWSTSHTAGVYLSGLQPSDPQAVNSSTGLHGFRSDMRVEFCTVSVLWAISPSRGSVDGGTSLYVTAADLWCFDGTQQSHRAQCRFYPCTAVVLSESSCIASARFLATLASFDPVSHSFRCPTPAASDFDPADNVAAGSSLLLRLFDEDANIELASGAPMIFRLLSASDAAAFLASLPTLENPGPNSEDLQLLRMGIYALLCNDTAHVLGLGDDNSDGSGSSSSSKSVCVRDCAGVFSGLAALDACGVCAGGTTGRAADADFDCAGRCFVDRASSAHSAFTSSSSARANASYCICENTNLTALVHDSFVRGLALSDSVQATLSEGGCARESFVSLSTTLSPTGWYRLGLLAMALVGFGLLVANEKVRARCACCCCCACCSRWCSGEFEEDEEGLDDGEEEDNEAAMRSREEEQEEEAYAASPAAPLGSSASAIAAPQPRSQPQSLPVAASPMHIRWHVEE